MSDDTPKPQKMRSKEAFRTKGHHRPHRHPSEQKTTTTQRPPSMAGDRKPPHALRQRSKSRSAPAKSRAKEGFPTTALDTAASTVVQRTSKRPRHSQGISDRGIEKFSGIDLSALGIHDPAKEAHRQQVRRVWLTSSVVAVVALFLVVGVALLLRWEYRRGHAAYRSTCDTSACSDYAAVMSAAIDDTKNPCDNYYKHVCGIELKGLKEGSMIKRIRVESFAKEATAMLAMKVPAKKQSPLEKAAAYLKACLALTNGTNIDEVKAALREGGIEWPDPSKASLVSGIVYMSAKLYTTVLVSVKLSYSADGSASPSVTFGLDDSFLEVLRMMTQHRTTKRILGHFQLTYTSFASSPDAADNKTRFNELFNDLIEIGGYFKGTADYEISLKDRSELKFDPRQIATVAPSTDYETWNAAFVRHFNESLDNIKWAVITRPKYFTTLFQAHSKFGATRILNIFGWLAIQSLIHYTSGKILASYYFSSEGKALDAHQQHCVFNTYRSFRYAINVDQWRKVPGKTLQYVLGMASDVWEAFQKLLAEQNRTLVGSRIPPPKDAYLEAILRHKSLSRPESIATFYASMPDMTERPLRNYVATKRAMEGHSRDPQFIDMNQARELELSERLRGFGLVPRQLEYPWMVPGGPYAVALAGLGLRMAARLYFQSVARLPDANQTHAANFKSCEALSESSSTPAVSMTERASGPSSAKARDLVRSGPIIPTTNGRQCTGVLAADSKYEDGEDEDIPAAAAALRIVWKAWKTAISRNGSLAMDLGPVPSDAVLFAFHCWFSCGPKPYNEMLCNAPLRHSRDFAQLYQCAEGSGMNPANKCPISV
ncbi:uncharacterized protein LOC144108305 [Amblyomma americanum]